MNLHYNQKHTLEEITSILKSTHDCIKQGRYTIAMKENRKENREFVVNYNLTETKRETILLNVEPEDFCYSLKNTKPGFEHETLYVFCPWVKLFNFDNKEVLIDIYIKFNIIKHNQGDLVIIISFHPRNKPINYLFR